MMLSAKTSLKDSPHANFYQGYFWFHPHFLHPLWFGFRFEVFGSGSLDDVLYLMRFGSSGVGNSAIFELGLFYNHGGIKPGNRSGARSANICKHGYVQNGINICNISS